MNNLKRYTIYACLIISFATYSFSLKSANDLVKEYQESMAIVSDYMVRTAHASEPQEASHEVLEEKGIVYDFSNSESVIIKATTSTEIERKIEEVFPKNSEQMIKLFTCESGLESDKAGDLSLTFEHNGEILGSSHGIGQVRTGGNEGGRVWNRAEKYGLSAKEFIKKLENPDFNLEVSREIYDGAGYFAWYNCSKRVGLIK